MGLYHCFKCFNKYNGINSIISHLRHDHRIRDKTEKIKCVANSDCDAVFLTFNGLQKHLKVCLPKSKDKLNDGSTDYDINNSQTNDAVTTFECTNANEINVSGVFSALRFQ